jgi:hypothetical protein
VLGQARTMEVGAQLFKAKMQVLAGYGERFRTEELDRVLESLESAAEEHLYRLTILLELVAPTEALLEEYTRALELELRTRDIGWHVPHGRQEQAFRSLHLPGSRALEVVPCHDGSSRSAGTTRVHYDR